MIEYVPYDELGITVSVFAIAMAFVVLTWNAIKAIRDWRAMARKPVSDQLANHETRIVHLEECCEDVHSKLAGDWQFRQEEVEINRLMLRAIKQMLQHEIDGDNVSELRTMEREIDEYLLNKA